VNTTQKSLIEICGDVRAGKVTARSRVESYLAAIAAKDAEIHAFNEIHADAARAQADAVDAAVKAGRDPGALAGAVIAIKDNIVMREGRTTCSSKMLANYRSPFDATVIERLRAAGAMSSIRPARRPSCCSATRPNAAASRPGKTSMAHSFSPRARTMSQRSARSACAGSWVPAILRCKTGLSSIT
jgi:aspartyl-tRNA(Asn)/glutamyl-tRNA(Gln) amidotransferase subunit A